MAQAGKERRVHPRKDVSLRVRVRADNVDDFVDQFAHNISKGGLFLRSQTPYPAGTMLQFEIQLKDGSSVMRGRGKVTWSQPPPGPGEKRRTCGMGVQFIGLDADSKAMVMRILEHKEELSSPPAPAPAREPEPSPAPAPAEKSLEIPTVVDEPALPEPEPAAPERPRPEPAPFWRRVPLQLWLLLGGAALGAVVVLLFLSLPDKDDPGDPTPDLQAAPVALAPVEEAPAETAPPGPQKPETVDPPLEESQSAAKKAEMVPRPVPKKLPRNRRFGYLSLNTNPWVEVYLGPRKLGVTPLVRVKLRTGRHRLKLVNWEDGINSPLLVRINPGKTTKLVKSFSP